MLICSNTMISYGERHVEVKSHANIHSRWKAEKSTFSLPSKRRFLRNTSLLRRTISSRSVSLRLGLFFEGFALSSLQKSQHAVARLLYRHRFHRSLMKSRPSGVVKLQNCAQKSLLTSFHKVTVKRNKSSLKMRGQVLLWNIDSLTFALYGLCFHSVFRSSLDPERWIRHISSFLLLAFSVDQLIFLLIFIETILSLEGTVEGTLSSFIHPHVFHNLFKRRYLL